MSLLGSKKGDNQRNDNNINTKRVDPFKKDENSMTQNYLHIGSFKSANTAMKADENNS